MDHALAFEPRFPGERSGNDSDAKMGFAAGARAGMAGMVRRFIDDIKGDRRQGIGKFQTNSIYHAGHGCTLASFMLVGGILGDGW